VVPVPAQRDGDRPTRRVGIAVGAEHQDGVVGESAPCRCYPPTPGIRGICGICGTCGFCGGDTVCVTVLVLVLVSTDVLTDVLMLGSVVVVGVVSAEVGDGAVVSVPDCVGAPSGADVDVVVAGVVVVVVCVGFDGPDSRLTINHTIRAIIKATIAPNAMSAAGLRYHGGSGGGSA
jgi:hypothetical protein